MHATFSLCAICLFCVENTGSEMLSMPILYFICFLVVWSRGNCCMVCVYVWDQKWTIWTTIIGGYLYPVCSICAIYPPSQGFGITAFDYFMCINKQCYHCFICGIFCNIFQVYRLHFYKHQVRLCSVYIHFESSEGEGWIQSATV